MNLRAAALFCALSSAAFAQTPLQFEVASVKPSAPDQDFSVKIGVHIDGAQVSCSFLSLADYVRMAYGMKQYQVVAPEWMASSRFDIKARLPEGVKGEQAFRDMLKALLIERFHMKLHTDSKDFAVYALEVAKTGAKLKESELEDTDVKGANVTASGGPQGVSLNLGHGSSFSFADNKIEGRKLSMSQFAETLARFTDKPIVDLTNLKGNYDFTIAVSDEDFNAMRIRSALTAGVVLPPQALKLLEMSSGDSLHSALQALGLRLESRKAPIEVVVVDASDKLPTEN